MVLSPFTVLAALGPLGTPELIVLFVLFVLLPGIVVAIVLGAVALSNRSRRKSQQAAPTPPPLAPAPPPHPKAPGPPPSIRALSDEESGLK